MTEKEARARIAALRKTIAHHAKLYYENDAPEISDYEYDALFRELTQLEALWPDAAADSPTQRVGGRASEKFAKVTHPVKMGSLTDVFDPEELRAFLERTRTVLLEEGIPAEEIRFTVEPKIDGLSVCLTYENGTLISVDFVPNLFFTYAPPIDIKLTQIWHWYVYLLVILGLAVTLVAFFYIPVFRKARKQKNVHSL